jgi:hypothetical protein
MNDADFRDWTRAELSAIRTVVAGLEARLPQRQRVVKSARSLAAKLLAEIDAGKVTSLGIVYVTDEGPMTGWATGGDLMEQITLIGALGLLHNDLFDPEITQQAVEEAKTAMAEEETP